MSDEKIFARNYSKKKQKMLSFGALIGCFIMALNLYTVVKPYLGHLPTYFHGSMNPIISNFSNSRSDVYEINGDVRIHGISSTIFIASSHDDNSSSWNIKPYPRKDPGAMVRVTNFKITMRAPHRIPNCSRNLDIPAILFSTGGHSGNHFHAYADVFIPLFLTSHHFNRTTIFLVTNQNPEWTSKYREIFQKLSDYDVYDIDKENEVLCFSRMVIGLKAHKDLEIDPSKEPTNLSIKNFTKLFQVERESIHDHHQRGRLNQPRMLIISRGSKSRKLMNERAITDMAQSLGFDVVVKKMQLNASLVAKLVNSFDVMVGVHGAGLTNMIFLPENAILIQIIPFGLKYLAKICFQRAAETMKLRYFKYVVSLNESSLLGKYPPDSEFYRNPYAISKRSFDDFRTVYLDNQDVNLDLNRFRETLLRALELVGTN